MATGGLHRWRSAAAAIGVRSAWDQRQLVRCSAALEQSSADHVWARLGCGNGCKGGACSPLLHLDHHLITSSRASSPQSSPAYKNVQILRTKMFCNFEGDGCYWCRADARVCLMPASGWIYRYWGEALNADGNKVGIMQQQWKWQENLAADWMDGWMDGWMSQVLWFLGNSNALLENTNSINQKKMVIG